MMKKILITGSTGFIGRILVPELSKKYKVICFVRNESKLNYLRGLGVSIIVGDLLEKESILSSLDGVNVVIHLATSHKNGKKEDFSMTKNLIEACEKRNIKRIIFLSSMASKRKNLDEYGKIKLNIENCFKKSELDYTILRPTVIYNNENLSLIGTSLKAIPLIIPIIGNGKYKLNPVHIADVIKVVVESIKNDKSIRKEYDLSGGENISFNEIVNICKERFHIKKLVVHVPLFLSICFFKLFPIVSVEAIKGINESSNADITSLKKELKVYPITFREGIKHVNI